MAYKKTITAHMVVKNEDCWVWFAIMSVIDYVDKMIIFDNGSTDHTVEVIKTIIQKPEYRDKVIFEQHPEVGVDDFWKLRQRQIEMSETDYMLKIDGDEIWYTKGITEARNLLDQSAPDMLTTPWIVCGGDIYHYRDSFRESYCIDGRKGAITNCLFSLKIPGFHCGGYYGTEGYKDKEGRDVQNNKWTDIPMRMPYLHMSVIRRSSVASADMAVKFRRLKAMTRRTYDYTFPKDFRYPEALYLSKPDIVPDPWRRNRAISFLAIQLLRNIKFSLCNKERRKLRGKNVVAVDADGKLIEVDI